MSLFYKADKPGKGIEKDEREKRGIVSFFVCFKRRYGKLMTIGLWRALFGLLFIPAGLGAVGSAAMARRCVRDTHIEKGDFFDVVKENWKLALISGLINNILTLGSAFCIIYCYNDRTGTTASFILLALSVLSFLLITFMRFYTPVIIITFNVSLGQLYKNAFLLAFLGFKRNFIILFSYIIITALIFSFMLINIYVGFGIALCLYLLIMVPMLSLLVQYNIFPVMYKYMIKPFMDKNPGQGQKTIDELDLHNYNGKI